MAAARTDLNSFTPLEVKFLVKQGYMVAQQSLNGLGQEKNELIVIDENRLDVLAELAEFKMTALPPIGIPIAGGSSGAWLGIDAKQIRLNLWKLSDWISWTIVDIILVYVALAWSLLFLR